MEPTRRKKAMTIAPSRIEGHRRFLEKASKVGGVISARSASEYLAIIDDHSVLKAEVERLNTWHSTLSEAWKARAIKAEAELAKQAPLIEAVMGAGIMTTKDGAGISFNFFTNEDDKRSILRAALALRKEKK
jgi:hypothetical protein